MNIPNQLTVMRIFMTPIFLAALVIDFPFHYFVALLVFGIASLTDFWDGKIARKYHLITNFGKFLDPIADKMLTTAAFLGFILLGHGAGIVWITFLVLAREFIVASMRMMAASKGNVVAADKWGKIKTVVQMFAVVLVLASHGTIDLLATYAPTFTALNQPLIIAYTVVLWISAALTVISGVNYLWKNKDCLGLKDL
ncbi:MAG: CDP-diacylglycerol--glycerol-3-phosphate 3-phosphatidyltransferase [Clostridia bacterium]|nr:CDP-diacylglycerol--glycerol-3-phosphate 3-phosphatidyltransferase [Clostridia bacterium]